MSNTVKSTRTLPKSLWGFYFRYTGRGYWGLIILWGIMGLFTAFDRVFQPLFSSWIVAIFETPVPDGMTLIQHAIPTILLITGINLAVTAMGTMQSWIANHWVAKTKRNTSETLTNYVHSQSMQFWVGRMAGSINSQIGYISQGFAVFEIIWRAFCRLSTIFVNGAILFAVNKYVAWVFMVIVVFRVIYSWRLSKHLKDAAKNQSSKNSALSGKIVDSISNYSLVKLFARRKQEEQHLAPARTDTVNAHLRVGFWNRVFFWIPDGIWGITTGINLLLCVYLYTQGAMTVADVVLAVGVYSNVFWTIGSVIDAVPDIIDKLGSASKAYEELVAPIDVCDAENAQKLNVTDGKIEIKNLSFKYRRKWVLNDLNLTINPGERVGIVGPSGAGKTTLVNLMMRFWDASRGEILIDGQSIRDVTQDSLRENISFIPQDPTMFNRTLRENIAYGRPNASENDIKKAAKLAAAHDFIMDTDKKYNSLVGDRGIKLSGGQRQRVAIARAFLKNAPILILDEATSALDSETELAIQESFDKLAAGRTTIAIAHRLSTLRNMDRIIVLKDGQIVEQGHHKTLLRRGGEYARLWKMQSGGFIQE